MVKQLGPILVLALLGGTALAQEPSPAIVRLLADPRPGLVIQPAIETRAALPRPRPPQPALTNPVDLLLALAEAF